MMKNFRQGFTILILILLFFILIRQADCCERKISSTSRIITDIKGKSIRNISCLSVDSKGNLYIGTSDKGVFFQKQKKWKQINTGNGLSHDSVHSIVCDYDDNLWIGTASGLNHIKKGEQGVKVRYAETGFDDNIVHALEIDSKHLYIGTTSGLAIADLQGSVQSTLTVKNGLPSNIINTIHSIDQEALYIGTASGLAIYSDDIVQVSEKIDKKWISSIASPQIPELTADVKKYFFGKLRLFYNIMLVEVQARATRCPDPKRKALFHTAELNIRHMLDKLNSPREFPIYIGTSDGCFKLDHDVIMDGDLSGGTLISSLWTTGVAVDRNNKPWMGSKNGCLNSNSNISIFSKTLDGFSDMIKSKQLSPEAEQAQNVIGTKDIVCLEFDNSGRLLTGIQGIGLYEVAKVLINHDAAYYGMLNKRNSDFSISSTPSKLSAQLLKLCEHFSGFVKSTFPSNKVWIGRFVDLNEADVKSYAYLVGRYSVLPCVINLSRIAIENPIVLIPYTIGP